MTDTPNKSKSDDLSLSVYGYGMLTLAFAVGVLLSAGYFNKEEHDIFYSWGLIGYAGASGALAVVFTRHIFPQYKNLASLTTAAIFAVFLFGCYFTSYHGYGVIFTWATHPELFTTQDYDTFWRMLGLAWIAATMVALACSATYLIIELWFGKSTQQHDNPPQTSQTH